MCESSQREAFFLLQVLLLGVEAHLLLRFPCWFCVKIQSSPHPLEKEPKVIVKYYPGECKVRREGEILTL